MQIGTFLFLLLVLLLSLPLELLLKSLIHIRENMECILFILTLKLGKSLYIRDFVATVSVCFNSWF